MTAPLSDFRGEANLNALGHLLSLTEGKQALAVGPGLGLGKESGDLVRHLIEDSELPIVVDADGLAALCGHLNIIDGQLDRQMVLTPHPGEMARLTGLSVAEIQADRFSVARDFAMQNGVVLVLKGARTLIVSPDGLVCINTTGHAGLASGGMGDVLTGLIAATLGVYLHGFAADRLHSSFGDAGLLATDVMREIPAARQALAKEA
jgi:NAD(P)H-hydrate epimerase